MYEACFSGAFAEKMTMHIIIYQVKNVCFCLGFFLE